MKSHLNMFGLDEIAGQKFDAINLEQVLEHTTDP